MADICALEVLHFGIFREEGEVDPSGPWIHWRPSLPPSPTAPVVPPTVSGAVEVDPGAARQGRRCARL